MIEGANLLLRLRCGSFLTVLSTASASWPTGRSLFIVQHRNGQRLIKQTIGPRFVTLIFILIIVSPSFFRLYSSGYANADTVFMGEYNMSHPFTPVMKVLSLPGITSAFSELTMGRLPTSASLTPLTSNTSRTRNIWTGSYGLVYQ
jgi:hypothetical protein